MLEAYAIIAIKHQPDNFTFLTISISQDSLLHILIHYNFGCKNSNILYYLTTLYSPLFSVALFSYLIQSNKFPKNMRQKIF